MSTWSSDNIHWPTWHRAKRHYEQVDRERLLQAAEIREIHLSVSSQQEYSKGWIAAIKFMIVAMIALAVIVVEATTLINGTN